jgi:hypothetical protein
MIVNCSTGETSVEPLTDDEIAANEKASAALAAEKAAQKEKAELEATLKSSAIAKLAALGLTEEEAAAIAG